jgi:hypothetical protein
MIYGILNYIDFYLMLLIVAICIPFFVIYGIIKGFQLLVRWYRNNKFAKSMRGSRYDPSKISGEHQCSICLQEYHEGDLIVILPCNG